MTNRWFWIGFSVAALILSYCSNGDDVRVFGYTILAVVSLATASILEAVRK